MRCIIAGSRTVRSYETVAKAIAESGWADEITEVISGTCRGPDQFGERWAERNGKKVTRFPAAWSTGRAAGQQRNRRMAEHAGPGGALIAVWDGRSRGTGGMIEIAKRLGLKVYVGEAE